MITVNFNTVHADHVPAEIRQKVTAWAIRNGFSQAAGVKLNDGFRPVEAAFPHLGPEGQLVREDLGDGHKGGILYDIVPVTADKEPFPLEAIPYV